MGNDVLDDVDVDEDEDEDDVLVLVLDLHLALCLCFELRNPWNHFIAYQRNAKSRMQSIKDNRSSLLNADRGNKGW